MSARPQRAGARPADRPRRARRDVARLAPGEVDELVADYQRTSAHLSHARPAYADPGLTARLTRLVAQASAPQARVDGIAPGPTLTAALDRALPADMREGMVRNTPLQRLGETEDIAAVALYLATPASGWVTGKILEVDGGAESSVWPG